MRAAILGHPATVGQQTGRSDPVHGVGGLCDQGGRLGPPRLLGHGGVGHQLGQAAR